MSKGVREPTDRQSIYFSDLRGALAKLVDFSFEMDVKRERKKEGDGEYSTHQKHIEIIVRPSSAYIFEAWLSRTFCRGFSGF